MHPETFESAQKLAPVVEPRKTKTYSVLEVISTTTLIAYREPTAQCKGVLSTITVLS